MADGSKYCCSGTECWEEKYDGTAADMTAADMTMNEPWCDDGFCCDYDGNCWEEEGRWEDENRG